MRTTGYTAMAALGILAVAAAPLTRPAVANSSPRPNFLVIVADDLGFSDLGAFGGEIATPNLDALAFKGVRFTSFYTAPTCSPTRAMLLTGQDHHQVGMGTMTEMLANAPQLRGRPGYEGFLDHKAETIAERLRAAGYRTMMAGKWHLGFALENQPDSHGFDQSFVLLQGGADHYGRDQGEGWDGSMAAGMYTENGKPARYPVGKYSADHFTDRMLEFIGSDANETRPFFAYMAFSEPHWPLQAPPELIAKYRGRYDGGPEVLRTERLKRMRGLGLIDEAAISGQQAKLADWHSLTREQKQIESRNMEVYAAMVDSLDRNVGRVLAALKTAGQLDNTVIVFMSDNGAEGTAAAQMVGMLTAQGVGPVVAEAMRSGNNDLAKLGTSGSYSAYGPNWAQAGSAPWRRFKGTTFDGGIRAPAFVAGPGVKGKRVVNSALSVRDIKPTLLEIAGLEADPPVGDRGPDGGSWVRLLAGKSTRVRSGGDVMAWELFSWRAIRIGDWKAVMPAPPPVGALGSAAGPPPPAAIWQLFDLKRDPAESTDLSAREPAKLKELTDAWNEYARTRQVAVVAK